MDALELCAVRMTKLLNTAPRRAVTRAYVATLPKRKKPVTVSPEEFERAKCIAADVVASAAKRSETMPQVTPVASDAPSQRSDKLRPKARNGKMRRRLVPPEAVHGLMRVQGRLCASCGHMMWEPKEFGAGEIRATIDHVIPLVLGGKDALGNIVAMHSKCNNKKGGRLPNGCELIWLLAVNSRMGASPTR